MTDTATTAALELVHPVTGELLDVAGAATTDLAAAAAAISEHVDRVFEFRQALVDEVARRMDRMNTRSEVVGDLKLTTNAPATESYPVAPTRDALQRLVDDDVLDPEVIARVIVTPPPADPQPKVAARELNKLKRHDDPRVARALGAVRQVSPQRRTLKVERVGG